jgi:hypothetical protein
MEAPTIPRTVYHVSERAIRSGEMISRYVLGQYGGLLASLLARSTGEPGALLEELRGMDSRSDGDGDQWRRADPATRMLIGLEAIFEVQRRAYAPTAPSRLDCRFAWADLQSAACFRSSYRSNGIIYECRIESGQAHVRDGGLLPPGIDLVNLGNREGSASFWAAVERGRRYWLAAEPMILPELLIDGAVVVVRACD